jgi:hypothetical protein
MTHNVIVCLSILRNKTEYFKNKMWNFSPIDDVTIFHVSSQHNVRGNNEYDLCKSKHIRSSFISILHLS